MGGTWLTNLTVLGEKEQVLGLTLQGCPSSAELVCIMLEVIYAVGMTPYGMPDVKHFPTTDGKGGVGCQTYITLTESWIIGGTWPAHGTTRIVLSSCEPYDADLVTGLLSKQIGPVLKTGQFEL